MDARWVTFGAATRAFGFDVLVCARTTVGRILDRIVEAAGRRADATAGWVETRPCAALDSEEAPGSFPVSSGTVEATAATGDWAGMVRARAGTVTMRERTERTAIAMAVGRASRR